MAKKDLGKHSKSLVGREMQIKTWDYSYPIQDDKDQENNWEEMLVSIWETGDHLSTHGMIISWWNHSRNCAKFSER